jgi:hypothetical protein
MNQIRIITMYFGRSWRCLPAVLRVAVWGLVCLLGGGSVFAQVAPPVPARIVTRYALTSAIEPLNNDPTAWRLLGSNDRGVTWSLLDVQTNQYFSGKPQRRVFQITNQTPYNIYRLAIDRVAWADLATNGRPSTQFEVQLSEIELMGPLADGFAEADLRTILTASQEHPLMGVPENAFDGDVRTRWRGFGARSPGSCWIQCEYAADSAVTATNLNQLAFLARRASARDRINRKGARILSELGTNGSGMRRVLSGYAITSVVSLKSLLINEAMSAILIVRKR